MQKYLIINYYKLDSLNNTDSHKVFNSSVELNELKALVNGHNIESFRNNDFVNANASCLTVSAT